MKVCVRQRERETEKEKGGGEAKDLPPVDSFHKCLQQLELSHAEYRSQKLHPRSYRQVAGTQYVRHHPIPLGMHQQEAGIGNRVRDSNPGMITITSDEDVNCKLINTPDTCSPLFFPFEIIFLCRIMPQTSKFKKRKMLQYLFHHLHITTLSILMFPILNSNEPFRTIKIVYMFYIKVLPIT